MQKLGTPKIYWSSKRNQYQYSCDGSIDKIQLSTKITLSATTLTPIEISVFAKFSFVKITTVRKQHFVKNCNFMELCFGEKRLPLEIGFLITF